MLSSASTTVLRQCLRASATSSRRVLVNNLSSSSRWSSESQARITPENVSAVAHAEGGTTKGSESARLQSVMTKQRQSSSTSTGSASNDQTITPEKVSAVAHAEGGTTKGSESARLQSEMTKQRQSSPSTSSPSGQTIAPENVSQVAQAEGGTTKGSESARLQSEMTKQRNASGDPTTNISSSAGSSNRTRPSSQDISAAAKAEGGPSRGSHAAQLQSEATKQQSSASTSTGGQSSGDHEADFQAAAEAIKPKIEKDPSSITKDEASTLHGLERKARDGTTQKGGVAATAQAIASQNENAA